MNLLVESLEGDIYLAFSVQGEQKIALRDGNHNLIQFHSLKQIRDYCENMHIESAHLKHHSAYDEMCGCAPSAKDVMTIDLKWS